MNRCAASCTYAVTNAEESCFCNSKFPTISNAASCGAHGLDLKPKSDKRHRLG